MDKARKSADFSSYGFFRRISMSKISQFYSEEVKSRPRRRARFGPWDREEFRRRQRFSHLRAKPSMPCGRKMIIAMKIMPSGIR
jgi:hypothetical protein